jgi:hypothetical protein
LEAERGKTEVMSVPHWKCFWKCLVLSSWMWLRQMYWPLVWSWPVWGKRALDLTLVHRLPRFQAAPDLTVFY